MSYQTNDRRAGRNPRERQHIPVETVSDYFSAERAHRPVTRGELASVLSVLERTRTARVWYRRLWRALTGRKLLDFFRVKEQEHAALETAVADGVAQGTVVVDRKETGR